MANETYQDYEGPYNKNKKRPLIVEHVIIALLLGALLSLFTRACNDNIGKEYVLKSQFDSLVYVQDSLNQQIGIKDIEIVDNQEKMKDLRASLFETTEKYNNKVKEVEALIAQGTIVSIKEVKVPYVDSVKMKKWEDSVKVKCAEVIKYYEDSTVMVGKEAKDSTGYYKIDAVVQKDGLKVNEIQFIDSQYISITEFKGGFFKRNTKGKLKFYEPRKTKVEIKHTNPYFKNTGTAAYMFQKKPNNGYLGGVVHGAIAGFLGGMLLISSP